MRRSVSRLVPVVRVFLLVAFAGAAAAEHDGAGDNDEGSDLRELWPLLLGDGAAERALFAATVGGERCLWRTDGTVAGTFRLDVDGGCLPLAADSPFVGSAPGVAYFVAGDAADRFWRSDGTAAGTWPLMRFADPGLWDRRSHFLAAPASGLVLFLADDTDGVALWASDDSPESAVRLDVPALAGTLPFLFQAVGGKVFFFVHRDGFTYELWATDGTSAGTGLVRSLGSESFPAGPRSALAVGGRLVFFLGGVIACAVELWASDGTGPGTAPIRELSGPSCPDAGTRQAIAVDGLAESAFFVADEGVRGAELWHTDGTAGGTYALTDLVPAQPFPDGFPATARPAALGGRLFFAADGGGAGTELWVSDGLPGAARRVADLCPGPCSSAPGPLSVVGGRLLFAAGDAEAGRELWTSTGTAAGTARATDLCPGGCGAGMRGEVVFGGSLLFVADDGASGEEWWSFTPPGGPAVRLSDLAPPRPFDPLVLVQPVGERAVFAADDGEHGREPWVTDGTPAGTHLLANLEHTPATDPGAPCTPSEEDLCLGGGRFRVSVEWRNQHAGPGEPESGTGRAVADGPSLDDSGTFWFFTPDNLELVVKVLDGTPVNGHHWVFWGALSDVEHTIRIEDTTSGETVEYHNPPGQLCGGSDTTAFPLAGGGFARTAAPAGALAAAGGPATRFLALDAAAPAVAAAHPFAPCVPDDRTLCLLDGTLAVTVDWTDQHNGGSGVGRAIPYADLTGFFSFFDPDNVELVVKALDGRTVNGKIWVFYGALSDVGYTIRVENREDGHAVRTYENPPGVICGRGDTAAF